MKKIKFSTQEETILKTIANKGEFYWSGFEPNTKEIEKALKNLYWNDFIERKMNGQVRNVFIASAWGELATRHNEAAEVLNEIIKEK